ncbi:MAG: hypothetical protein K2X93_16755 [Candidatus Obscuribacterales bacterium]|nr:hypothetical protein [Candidatus Obscuribacterales bacterium]
MISKKQIILDGDVTITADPPVVPELVTVEAVRQRSTAAAATTNRDSLGSSASDYGLTTPLSIPVTDVGTTVLPTDTISLSNAGASIDDSYLVTDTYQRFDRQVGSVPILKSLSAKI